MVIQECHDYFDLLIDKIESAYFTDEEKDILITQACIEYVKKFLPSAENPGANLELDQINYNNLYSLIYSTGSTSMSTTGVITMSAVQALLNTASGSTDPFMAILGLGWTKSSQSYPVKWTKNNNWLSYLGNSFKKGSATAPRYKHDKTNFTFYPIDVNAAISFTLLKQPKATSLAGGVTIELPEHTHKSIIELAVDLAATSLREPELKGLNRE